MPIHQGFEEAVLDLWLANDDTAAYWASLNITAGAGGNMYVALHSTSPGAGASTQTTGEVSYTGYARATLNRLPARWTATASATGASYVYTLETAFGACTGGSATANFWSIGELSTGAGKLYAWGPIASVVYPFTADSSTERLSVAATAFNVNDPVCLLALPPLGALPGGLSEGTIYYVLSPADSVVQTFQLSTSPGGSNIDITTSGDGLVALVTPLPIVSGVTPKIAANTLTIRLR